MIPWKWIIIIAKIAILIAQGMSKKEAVKAVAKQFGIDEKDIWKRGGF